MRDEMISLKNKKDKERIDNLIKLHEYDELSKLSFQFDVNELKDNNYYVSWIMKANLESKNYDLNCFFIENLIRNDIETFEEYNYLFTCLIKIDDLYRIKSYMTKSKLLNEAVVTEILDGDLSVYASLSNMEDENMLTCILLMLFLNDLFDNFRIEAITKDDEMIAFYELIDLAYTNGIDLEKLETIKYIGELLFK